MGEVKRGSLGENAYSMKVKPHSQHGTLYLELAFIRGNEVLTTAGWQALLDQDPFYSSVAPVPVFYMSSWLPQDTPLEETYPIQLRLPCCRRLDTVMRKASLPSGHTYLGCGNCGVGYPEESTVRSLRDLPEQEALIKMCEWGGLDLFSVILMQERLSSLIATTRKTLHGDLSDLFHKQDDAYALDLVRETFKRVQTELDAIWVAFKSQLSGASS